MPPGTFLVDGFVRGTWTMEREGARATLRIEPFTSLPKAELHDVRFPRAARKRAS